jgi:hypothetical protein
MDNNGIPFFVTPPEIKHQRAKEITEINSGFKENKEANTSAWNTHLTKVQVLNTKYKVATSAYEKMLNSASILPAEKQRAEKAMNEAFEALTAQVNTPPGRIVVQPQQAGPIVQQPVAPQPPSTPQYKAGQIIEYKGKRLKFIGGNPKDRKSWTALKGGR